MIKSVMGTGIAFGPYNVINVAQALCGEYNIIRKDRSKLPNRRRCSSLFSLSKSHVRKLVNLSVNCGFRTKVFEAP